MIEHKYTNKLIEEKSPYLLQHAHNPVAWYPWGEEAFKKAKHDDKPIFLSIGYSTCHWCHVMERESFENEEVAEVLNKHFVCIKVDREERPDIDSVYMKACQAMTGSGGWPLTILMTPDQKPFYAATYLPPKSKYSMVGVIDIVEKTHELWENDREHLMSFANEFLNKLSEDKLEQKEIEEYEPIVRNCFESLCSSFDKTYGGFGRAPKFPTPQNLLFLMRYHKKYHSKKALDICFKTLESMIRGGIFDHVGGGFSRYSTDQKWLVPHFEKMLYDNALLAMCYAEAYSIEPREIFKDAAEQTLLYISENMTDEKGGFYSAEDADSEGEEGKFYLWSYDEVIKLLGEERGKEFCRSYDITKEGNFEGSNILNLIENNQWEEDFDKFKSLKGQLKAVRRSRIHPHKDDKILLGWNGLCIMAYAICGRIFHNQHYVDKAVKAFSFIENHMIDHETSRLYARYRDGEKKYFAYHDDYAYMLWASLELYDAALDGKYLERAEGYAMEMIRLFWDEKKGGFFTNAVDTQELIFNPKDAYDNALPSGNSVAAYALIRLGRIKEIETLISYGKKTIDSFSYELERYPHALSYMCATALFYENKYVRAILTGDPKSNDYKEAKMKMEGLFLPFVTKLYASNKADEGDFTNFMLEDDTALWICDNFACQQPIKGIDKIISEIDRLNH